ncbi:endonuclease VII domain-containing protein [Micromonospora chersina]
MSAVATGYCYGCKVDKPLTDFGTVNGRKRSQCKACLNAYRRDYYRRSPQKLADVRMRNLARYGLTPEDYDRKHAEQSGLCAICGTPETAVSKLGEPRMLSVDHNHQTGAVRDLLCGACNFMVGFLEKNPVDPHLFVAYLDRHRGYPGRVSPTGSELKAGNPIPFTPAELVAAGMPAGTVPTAARVNQLLAELRAANPDGKLPPHVQSRLDAIAAGQAPETADAWRSA